MNKRELLERWVEDCGLLSTLNLLFASNYLFSSSGLALGFMYRQDGYWYTVVLNHLKNLLANGFVPVGVTWLRYAYCGLPEVVYLDPMYAVYLLFDTITNDFVVSWKITVFLFYIISAITMYYLTFLLTSDRIASLVSSTAYSFSQVMVFEVFLGHVSMAVGFAIIPLVIATYIKSVRNASRPAAIASALLLSWLVLLRPDFGYFAISFMLLIFIYFIMTTRPRTRTIILTSVIFLLGFLLSYPLIEPRYLSIIGDLRKNVGRYTFDFYSPEAHLLFIPSMKSLGVYLGIEVLFFSIIGSIVILSKVSKVKSRSSENEKFYYFLFVASVLYLILGLGATTPVYGLLYNSVPFFSIFQVPTRWLIVAQLCLAIIAGIGASFVIKFLVSRSTYRVIATIVVVTAVFLDASIFVAPSLYEKQGWRPIAHYDSDSALFMFPQTSYVPPKSKVYEYIRQDTSGPYRIISAPIVYSRSYYQYIQYLKDTNVTFAYDYVQFPFRSEFQTEVYNGLRYGNFSEDIGGQMALLGIKYLVYNFYWGEWEGLVKKLNETEDLEFLLQDEGYILFRNRRFGNIPVNSNLIRNAAFENNEDFWIPWHANEGFSEPDHNISKSDGVSMKLFNVQSDGIAGRTQYVNVPKTSPFVEYKLSGWTKAENVCGVDPMLAIRATMAYTDGSHSKSVYARFSAGTHDWEYSTAYLRAEATKTVDSIIVSFFLRNGTGKAWIDDIYLSEISGTNEWDEAFSFKELYKDVNALLSEQNKANATTSLDWENSMTLRIRIATFDTAYIVVSESFDSGWQIHQNSTVALNISEYNDLITIHVKRPGIYALTLKFESYSQSLAEISLYYVPAIVLASLFLVPLATYSKISKNLRKFICSDRMRQ